MTNPIRLAYQAARYVPTEAYRTHKGGKKKMYNPIKTAPTLVQAMSHLGEVALPLKEAKERAGNTIQEPEAKQYIEHIHEWSQLRDFLDTLALFLKAEVEVRVGRKKRRQAMRKFVPKPRDQRERWDTAKLVQRADEYAQAIAGKKGINDNKLKKLESRIKGCGDEWEVLASLAQYYPLSGVPSDVIDDWVSDLGNVSLDTFKQLVSYTVVLYRAERIKKKG
ncbi:MAG TPA: hypothetical protein EYP49_20740 [Anaerolineae bacterium]|nr:hypothetical protein [Anaerolineae bacterium]